MKNWLLLGLCSISSVAVAAGVPIGKYIQGSQSANTLPNTGLDHTYLPFTGSMTLAPSYDSSSNITSLQSKNGGAGGVGQFSLTINNTESSQIASSIYVVVLGSQGLQSYGTACQITNGENIPYTDCFNNTGLTKPIAPPYTLYVGQHSFSGSNYMSVGQPFTTCRFSGVPRDYNPTKETYTLSASIPYTLSISAGGCLISAT